MSNYRYTPEQIAAMKSSVRWRDEKAAQEAIDIICRNSLVFGGNRYGEEGIAARNKAKKYKAIQHAALAIAKSPSRGPSKLQKAVAALTSGERAYWSIAFEDRKSPGHVLPRGSGRRNGLRFLTSVKRNQLRSLNWYHELAAISELAANRIRPNRGRFNVVNLDWFCGMLVHAYVLGAVAPKCPYANETKPSGIGNPELHVLAKLALKPFGANISDITLLRYIEKAWRDLCREEND